MSFIPNIGPCAEAQKIALAPFVLMTLNVLFSLFTKEKMKALESFTCALVESHAISVNPPKMLPFVDFMIVRVFALPSHLT
jgi:hypothetical protein